MDRRQVPLQTRFLGEIVVAVEALELTFPAALPFHVPAQIAEHCVAALALLTAEAERTC
jgi:hypothetical protein